MILATIPRRGELNHITYIARQGGAAPPSWHARELKPTMALEYLSGRNHPEE